VFSQDGGHGLVGVLAPMVRFLKTVRSLEKSLDSHELEGKYDLRTAILFASWSLVSREKCFYLSRFENVKHKKACHLFKCRRDVLIHNFVDDDNCSAFPQPLTVLLSPDYTEHYLVLALCF